MKLNLDFYDSKDKYSDGDIEDKIIEFIKKYPDDYEEAFKEDNSWPVYYHFSDVRKNSVRWYPFEEDSTILEVGAGMGAITEYLVKKCKSVTSIELSKRRATAIALRNKKADNFEIIVGNFQKIKLNKKYDYILLNGVLEYGALYMNTDNPYEDFINKLKKNLKPNGKILIAIENKFGIKYWCGANEDHTDIRFDGINDYPSNINIRTFSKIELEKIANKCNMNCNFYYMFPDYKFPKIVYTDKALEKGVYCEYEPYYCKQMNMILSEKRMYRQIYKNKEIPFFANSFFLELSANKEEHKVDFVKFNNEQRKSQYDLITYMKGNKFYKYSDYNSTEQISKIIDNYNICKNAKINIAKVVKEKDKIYSVGVKGKNLNDILINCYNNKDYDLILREFEKLIKLIKSTSKLVKPKYEDSIFKKYNMKINEEEYKKLKFLEYGLIDLIPSNILVDNNEYVIIDQEWSEENVPIEYIIYRAITYLMAYVEDVDNLKEKLFKKYNIDEKLYEELERKFIEDKTKDSYSTVLNYYNNCIYMEEVQGKVKMLEKALSDITNSKGYKALQSLRKIKRKVIFWKR